MARKVMFEHLRYRGMSVETRSAAGEVALKVLGLNDAERVEFRDRVSGIIRYLERVKRQLQETLEAIDQRGAADPAALAEVTQEREAVQNDLIEVQRHLAGYVGDT